MSLQRRGLLLAGALSLPALRIARGADATTRVLVVGDSQAQGLAAGLQRQLRRDGSCRVIDRSRIAIDHALSHPAPVLMVAHGGTLYVLAALLGVAVDMRVLGNAQPLRFERSGTTWRLQPLLRQVDGGAAVA